MDSISCYHPRATFTRQGSQVQSLYRPPKSEAASTGYARFSQNRKSPEETNWGKLDLSHSSPPALSRKAIAGKPGATLR
jgi:hypothetical protein